MTASKIPWVEMKTSAGSARRCLAPSTKNVTGSDSVISVVISARSFMAARGRAAVESGLPTWGGRSRSAGCGLAS